MKEITRKNILIIITYTIILIFLLINFPQLFAILNKIIKALNPLFWGVFFAFIINLLMKKYEKLFYKSKEINGVKRAITLTLSILTILIVIAFIVALLIPELMKSTTLLVNNISVYSNKIINFGNDIIVNYNLNSLYAGLIEKWTNISQNIGQYFIKILPNLFSGTISFFNSLINMSIGLVFAIYILFSKEKLLIDIKKIIRVFSNDKIYKKILKVSKIINKSFSSFIGGQLIEAIILGTLCTIGMVILRMPYAILIGVVIGLTSLIPIFGAYIGAIPSAFILFMEDPILAVLFLIYLIILQQFESNVIYPRVVGKSIGLSGLFILLAVVLGASLGGIVGVLIGVPLFSVLYTLLQEYVNNKMKEKKLEIK